MPSNPLVATPIDDAARLAWRRGLNEMTCRELAAEYKAALSRAIKAGGTEADISLDLVDANAEYLERYAEADAKLGVDRRKIKRSKGGKGRSQKGSLSPLYNRRGELI